MNHIMRFNSNEHIQQAPTPCAPLYEAVISGILLVVSGVALVIIFAINPTVAGNLAPIIAWGGLGGISLITLVTSAALSYRARQKLRQGHEEAPQQNEISSAEPREIPPEEKNVQPIFRQAHEALKRIDLKNIDPTELTRIRTSLNVSAEVSDLIAKAPAERSTPHPLDHAADEYQCLILWIESIQRYYDFFSRAMREADAEGEFHVADNGDCLFEASCYHSDINNDGVQNERSETVRWIQENLESNETLQVHLLGSITEHYLAKVEHLQAEREGLQAIEDGSIDRQQEISRKNRLQEIIRKIEALDTTCRTLTEAENHIESVLSEPISALLEDYFQEMSRPGTYAGRAELYALSCRHQVCFKIYSKNQEGEVDSNPYVTMNDHFESTYHFTHSHNHYNPYHPPAE